LTSGTSCKAIEEALTKADMKPNFTPCFFKKASLYLSRSSESGLKIEMV